MTRINREELATKTLLLSGAEAFKCMKLVYELHILSAPWTMYEHPAVCDFADIFSARFD